VSQHESAAAEALSFGFERGAAKKQVVCAAYNLVVVVGANDFEIQIVVGIEHGGVLYIEVVASGGTASGMIVNSGGVDAWSAAGLRVAPRWTALA
jgi:hypothetical protein